MVYSQPPLPPMKIFGNIQKRETKHLKESLNTLAKNKNEQEPLELLRLSRQGKLVGLFTYREIRD